MRGSWQEAVLEPDKDGKPRVNRITYEICVLQALREQLRCKEIWVRAPTATATPTRMCPRTSTRSGPPTMPRCSSRTTPTRSSPRCGRRWREALADLDRTLPAEPARADPAQGRRLDRAVQAGAPARAGEPPRPQGGPGGPVADDQPARHAQGDRPARRLHRRLPQRHGLREHGPGHPAAAAAAVPVRPGDQHRPQADGAGEHGATYKDLLYVRRRFITRGPTAGDAITASGQRDLPRPPAADLGRRHDRLRLRLEEVRRLGPEPDDRVARPLRRARA